MRKNAIFAPAVALFGMVAGYSAACPPSAPLRQREVFK